MPKTKEQKKEIIKDLQEKISRLKSAVLVDFSGCNSEKIFQLRDELKKANCLLQVVKKTLLKKALQQVQGKFLQEAKEIDLLEKIGKIKGQMALVFGFEDEVAPAKITYDASQKNEHLKILAGILGKEFLEKDRILELAKLPSKPELIGRLLGNIQAPISNFVYVLNGNIKGLTTVLFRISETKQ